jgi:hypothetical protein
MKKVTLTEFFRAVYTQNILLKLPRLFLLIVITMTWLIPSSNAQGNCSMSCSNANIGIAEECIAYVSPLSVAKVNQTGCDSTTWIINIRETMNGPIIATGTIANPAELDGLNYLNRTLVAEVIDQASGNKCWAFIVIEDKSSPIITCEDITLECDEMISYIPEVEDNCQVIDIIKIDETRRNASCDISCGAVLYAPTEDDDPVLRASISALIGFPVDYFDARTGTPTFAQLQNYATVITWVNFAYQNNVLFGNNLADFVDAGGSVILGVFSTFTAGNALAGRIMNPGYSPVTGGLNHYSTSSWNGVGPSEFFDGVATLTAYYRDILSIQGNGIEVANFIDGEILVARRPDNKVIYLNGLANMNGFGNAPTGDWPTLIANSIELRCNNSERGRGITSVVTQTWVAVDHVGLRDTCTVDIYVLRPEIDSVQCPVDEVTLSCSGNWERDLNGNPHPSVTGYPTYKGVELDPNSAFLYCNLLVGYTDLDLPGFCPGERKVMRQWRVSEWYCGVDYDFVCVQVILLRDTESPVIVCPPTRIESTDFYSCAQSLFVARPDVSDNCSPTSGLIIDLMFGNTFINNFQGGFISGFQPGENIITYNAYDNCGNSSSCTQLVIVNDQVAPIAICKSFTTASLGSDGTARVYWQSFDDGSYDNCGIDYIEVRRMNPHICDPIPTYAEYVPVCCVDVAAPIMVIMRVWDISGNVNSCMVELEVQDKLPAYIQCPPNLSVDCGFDLSDLSVFGNVANLNIYETRDSIFIDGIFRGIDGFAYDNCDVTITVIEDIDLTLCGAGTVTRIHRAVGAGNNTVAECTQIISIINDVSYLPQTIVWPCDIMVTNYCTNDPSVDLSPAVLAGLSQGVAITRCPDNRLFDQFYDRPRYADDECTQVGTSYKDHVFEIQDSACYKILREWKIIDWCAMEQNPGRPVTDFIYHYLQVIKIKNTIGPEIGCAASIEVCSYQTNCSQGEELTVSATATDDCTREEDLYWRWEYFENSGSVITSIGFSNTLTRNFPVGAHRVRFIVEDKCGNTAACTIEVTVRDCKQPTPICHHLVIDLMVTGMVDINAINFNAGSYDNCTPPADLVYRIERRPFVTPSGDSPPSSALSFARFDCDDLGLNDVRIWVMDLDGNWDYCETTLLVQNNAGANCFGSGGGIIAGMLHTEINEAVEKAEVYLQGQVTNMYITGNQGMFEFGNIEYGKNFNIVPMRLDEPANGVSTLDILKIQRHILGIEALDSPYKIIAADVNKSGAVTGADLVEIRRLILKTIDEFSNAPSWRFVPRAYQFYDELDPIKENFPEQVQILNFQGQVPAVEFVAIKVGDVNESVTANSTNYSGSNSRSKNNLILDVMNTELVIGEVYEIEFRSADFRNIFGYQFTMAVDPSKLILEDVKAGILPINEEHFGFSYLNEGLITTSWNSSESVSSTIDDVLFTLVFKASGSGILSDALQVNSTLTNAEAYDELSGETKGIQLAFNGDISKNVGEFELFQNRPNPFNGSTIIGFQLPEVQSARLTIYDMTGKVVHSLETEFAKGYNEIELQSGVLNGQSGMLYYELKTETFSAVKKMIRVN